MLGQGMKYSSWTDDWLELNCCSSAARVRRSCLVSDMSIAFFGREMSLEVSHILAVAQLFRWSANRSALRFHSRRQPVLIGG